MHRDHEALDCDGPKSFRRKSTIAPLKGDFTRRTAKAADATAGTGNGSTNQPSGARRPSHISTTGTNSLATDGKSSPRHKKHSPTAHTHKSRTQSNERRGSGTGSHHHLGRKEQIYSHLLQTRSVSMVRSSTMSSRNSASLSEFLSRSDSNSGERF